MTKDEDAAAKYMERYSVDPKPSQFSVGPKTTDGKYLECNCGQEILSQADVKIAFKEGRASRDEQITALVELVKRQREALRLIERSYPLSGERMAHQDYALKLLSTPLDPSIAHLFEGEK